jgi:glutathione reductase (NADPH)
VIDFDVVVIGTGSAGTTAAVACAKAGKRVAIVDELAYGGTCPLRGCDPKKVLVGAAELVDWARRMHGSGTSGDVEIDWPALMRFKRSFTDPVPQEREAELTGAGIATYHGAARFVDRTSIGVGTETLRARHIVLACGARPATLNLTGEELLITSTGFLDLEEMAPRVVFIGGGYIAFEFAHVAVRAGATPVILQRGPRVLAGFDPALVDDIVEVSKTLGIDVRVNVDVRSIERRDGGLRVHASSAGSDFSLDCELAVHAAGRVPDLDGLALDIGGVERDAKGVTVNEFLQSRSNPLVYAAGDCADGGGLPLTPTAGIEGGVAARNILEGNRYTLDFSGLASIVYSIPALATVGLTEEQARDQGIRFRLYEGDTTQWYSSRRIRARRSRYRLLVDQENGTIVGAHVLGPHAEELINIFALSMRAKIPAATLEQVLFAYPTASSDIEPMLQS